MGEVANLRGDLDGASRLYREAAAGTAEAIRRDPDDPQRLYDHAQNQFYFADIAVRRGRIDSAEAAFREYKRLADRMVELAPDNMKWRMEVQNADANLATVLSKRRRFNEAATQWAQAYRMIDALATADPNNRDYQQSLVELIAWYADAEMDAGHLDSAIALRLRNVDLLTRLSNRTQDVNYQYRLVLAERNLGNLYASQDRMDLALQHMRTAVAQADRLAQVEPDNAKWLGYGAKAKSDLADLLLRTGALAEARASNEAACAIVGRLLSKVGNQPRVAREPARLLDTSRAIGPCRGIERRGCEQFRARSGDSKDSQRDGRSQQPLFPREGLSAARRHAAKRRGRGRCHHSLAGCACRLAGRFR